jgi:hypothetical protein
VDFSDFQTGTERTNVYSEAIDNRLWEIERFINDHYNEDPQEADRAFVAVSELRQILNTAYAAMGYAGEVAEILNKLKKVFRGDVPYEDFRKASKGEQGDALYYAAQLAARTNYTLEHIAISNSQKLQDRMKRGVIRGNGDTR